jgi:hypothetical protein
LHRLSLQVDSHRHSSAPAVRDITGRTFGGHRGPPNSVQRYVLREHDATVRKDLAGVHERKSGAPALTLQRAIAVEGLEQPARSAAVEAELQVRNDAHKVLEAHAAVLARKLLKAFVGREVVETQRSCQQVQASWGHKRRRIERQRVADPPMHPAAVHGLSSWFTHFVEVSWFKFLTAALRSPDLRHTTKREGDTSCSCYCSKEQFFTCHKKYE